MACSMKERVRNCLKWLQLSPPHHSGSSKPPPYLLSVSEAEDYLFAPVEEADISDHPYRLSLLWCTILSVWSQDTSSGKENGEENELGHTLVKGWCTDSQGPAHIEGKEQNKDRSKHSLHPLGWTRWKNPHLNLKESAGD